ncbi:hypothetical protein Slin15195_G026990 [Septoria linicola]|uniref:Uncharacterized protein n=1 Tax=Septoria linicola TaxID=215465 RepID=A0A9Q9EFW4_9PEZI|nr:hypothetical protein Slin14017_G026060 [Septoria linicola]USW49380.1 hypothetical protein Slin15195_G026990 [Septoria linicola]
MPPGGQVSKEEAWNRQSMSRCSMLAKEASQPMLSAIPQFDGSIDLRDPTTLASANHDTEHHHKHERPSCNEMFASRWADANAEQQSQPTRVQTPELAEISLEDETIPDSPASIDSIGNWQYPPRRLQHIAAFIEPSATLTEKERAAVLLWKAASKAQLYWDQHMRKVRQLRSGHNDEGTCEAKDCQIERDEYEESELKNYEELAGFVVKACYGNNLSEVLHWLEGR